MTAFPANVTSQPSTRRGPATFEQLDFLEGAPSIASNGCRTPRPLLLQQICLLCVEAARSRTTRITPQYGEITPTLPSPFPVTGEVHFPQPAANADLKAMSPEELEAEKEKLMAASKADLRLKNHYNFTPEEKDKCSPIMPNWITFPQYVCNT